MLQPGFALSRMDYHSSCRCLSQLFHALQRVCADAFNAMQGCLGLAPHVMPVPFLAPQLWLLEVHGHQQVMAFEEG